MLENFSGFYDFNETADEANSDIFAAWCCRAWTAFKV